MGATDSERCRLREYRGWREERGRDSRAGAVWHGRIAGIATGGIRRDWRGVSCGPRALERRPRVRFVPFYRRVRSGRGTAGRLGAG